MTRILVVDDDEAILDLVTELLEAEGYDVRATPDSRESLRTAFEFRPEVVLLDIMMPEMDGWEICRKLRDFYDGTIIMLTALDGETDMVKGLDIGADDYIVKPFSRPELLARIRAHLRESGKSFRNIVDYRDDYLQIDLHRRTVRCMGLLATVTPHEFAVLACLVRRAGEVLGQRRLLTEALGPDYADQLMLLKVHIRHLREKIEPHPASPRYIVTHRGIGYMFQPNPPYGED